jgi:hypothetical protein
MKEEVMFRIPSRLVVSLVALGLSLAITPSASASASSTPTGFARTDVKIEAKDITVTASPAASPHLLTPRSLTPAHAVEVHPYVPTPDTEDTHSLRVESNARTDVKIETKGIRATASPVASPHPLPLESLAPAHAVEVHPYVAMPDTEDTHSLQVESK